MIKACSVFAASRDYDTSRDFVLDPWSLLSSAVPNLFFSVTMMLREFSLPYH